MGTMRNKVLTTLVGVIGCVVATPGAAQDIDLAVGGAGAILSGTATGARAGISLDQGPVSEGAGPGRRDLIIGSPGGASLAGRVHILFGGTHPSGEVSLTTANTLLNGAAAGDEFGVASAVGGITVSERPTDIYPKNLVVGAPGSLGNRGIVYVYVGGFVNGSTVPTSSAVLRIIGNTGDRLGSSLATADLNFDGYREVVIGAPGQGRIYIIAGGPSVSGTIDLSVQPATLKFEYPGLGASLAAGDVTGDDIYDVVAGHPDANAVHVMKGRNGVMPTAFDMSFSGIDTGDRAGAAIRLPFLGGDDRIRDIVIGAPGGDGPGNGRTDAGEAYVLFGGPQLAGGSLAAADATFYGADANGRLGAQLGSGDINRDFPNDIVIGAPAARSGAGRAYVYYGRDRGAIMASTDFAFVPASRGILGDPAAGGIGSVFVWEVTGEGARDVIIGAPHRNSNTGAVYFVISPRLELATTSTSLSGYQGIVSSSPIAVRNISNIPITWETSSNRSWLSATPSGSTSASTPGDVVINVNGQGLRPGTYTGVVTITSTSPHLTMQVSIDVTFEVRETQPTPWAEPVAGSPPGNRYKLFWRHGTEGWLAFWHMNGFTLESTSSLSINRLTDTSWQFVAMADLNGDGHKDLVLRHTSGGMSAWMLYDNQVVETSYLSITSIDPAWKIRGAGDLNGDRKADLVLQHATTGELTVWFMDGFRVASTAWLSIRKVPLEWVIQAVGDTNGDGKADVIWRKMDTGGISIWMMNGATVTQTGWLSVSAIADMNWQIVATEDVNGDGTSDMVWQHAGGAIAAWTLNGYTVLTTQMTNPSGATNSAWRITGPK